MNIQSHQIIHTTHHSERGNAMIYVLIAVALFASLTFILSRNTDTAESNIIPEHEAELYTTQMVNFSAQAKSVIDQMVINGSDAWSINFERPGDATFNDAPRYNKIFHPDGGGLSLPRLAAKVSNQTSADPPAGWYMGRFNNIEWTDFTGDDVILVAHQIRREVCEKINEHVTGSNVIPAIAGTTLANILVDEGLHTGTNEDFTTSICADCENHQSLCVSNAAATRFSYYSVMLSNPRD